MNIINKLSLVLFCLATLSTRAFCVNVDVENDVKDMPSVAGFFPIANSGRIIYNFNQGWKYHLYGVHVDGL